MTPRVVERPSNTGPERRLGRAKTIAGVLARIAQGMRLKLAQAKHELERATLAIPLCEYQHDPIGFAADVLGITLLSEPQKAILRACVIHREVSVTSGNGVGKSFLHSIIAWWKVCCFPGALVLFTSTVDRQVLVNMWQPFVSLWKRAPYTMGPEPGRNHHRPWLSEDGTCKVLGGAPKTRAAVMGTRGEDTTVCADEASGILDDVNVGLQALITGRGLKINTGNPTSSSGWFREKFREESGCCIPMSCLDSVNVIAGEELIPGLVSRAWVEQCRKEWGEDDPRWKVHVLGQFLDVEDLRVFSPELIDLFFDVAAVHDVEAVVRVGIDLAGQSVNADKIIVTFARGLVVERQVDLSGESIKAVADYVKAECSEWAAFITYDAGGEVGKEFGEHWADTHHFVTPMYAGAKSSDRHVYPTIRDELPFRVKDFFRAGGRLAQESEPLRQELAAIKINYDPKQRIIVEPKDKVRKLLRRSPDHFDSLSLCLYDWALTRELRNKPKTPVNQAPKRRVYGATGFGY